MRTLSFNHFAKIVSIVFGALVLWWIFININHLQDTNQNFLYGAGLGILPVIGSLLGFANAKKWGGFSSAMGRAIFFLSLGLLTWGVGTLTFAYYNVFLHISVPYPSLADGFYIVSWILWAISMVNLSKATGVKFQLRSITGRVLMFIIPIVTIAVSYYALIVVARQGVVIDGVSGILKTFFDIAYPVGDIVIITIALLIYTLSFKYLGGYFRMPILIVLLGFAINYLGDFSFVYGTTKGTYFVANWVDLIYTSAFFLLSLGVSLMDPHYYSKNTPATV